MILTHPTLTVFTCDEWLAQMFDGYEKGSGRIERVNDADGDPIIGKSILDDTNWNLNIPVTHPVTQEVRPLIGWLREKAFRYNDEENI